MKFVNQSLELGPKSFICCCVGMAEPDSEDVVDEMAIDEEVVSEPVEDHILEQGVEDCCPRR